MSKARELAELGAVYDSGALSNRNLIINGNMEIAQRGTSQTSAGYGTLDRFNMSLSGATATMTQESFTIGQTDVPGSYKYLKLAVSTGNNNSGVYYKAEAKDAIPFVGKKVTLSYYAKGTSPAAGLQVGIGWYDGSNSSSYDTLALTLTSTWTKYTHTFDVPSISGVTLTNANAYLEVKWAQFDTDTGTGAYEVNLAQVQLEEGDTATEFEHELTGVTLSKCQRYFEKVGNWGSTSSFYGLPAYKARSSSIGYPIQYKVEKRVTPSVTMYDHDGTTTGVVTQISDGTDFAVQFGPTGDVRGMYRTQHATQPVDTATSAYGVKIEADAEI